MINSNSFITHSSNPMADMAENGTVKEAIQIFARVKPTREETSKVRGPRWSPVLNPLSWGRWTPQHIKSTLTLWSTHDGNTFDLILVNGLHLYNAVTESHYWNSSEPSRRHWRECLMVCFVLFSCLLSFKDNLIILSYFYTLLWTLY